MAKYKVMTYSKAGVITSFIVTAQADDWDDNKRGEFPYVAEFHVSKRYPEEDQRTRAKQYRDYMNSQQIEPDPIR